MSTPSKSWITGSLLPKDMVQLGDLVQTPEAPEQDSHTPEARPLKSEIHTVQDFEDTSSRSVGGSFLVNLTKFCSAGVARGTDYAATVKSPICRTVQLYGSDSFFRKICQEPGTQNYLNPKYVWNRSVYLVTGIKTIEDASITVAQSKDGSKKGKVTFPVSKSLSGINFDYSMLDCSVDLEISRSKGNSTRFKVPGEKIYAVQYRRVEFSHFPFRNPAKVSLEQGNRWKVYVGVRGAGTADDDSNCHVLEARLGHDFDQYDIGYSCKPVLLGKDEMLYVPSKVSSYRDR